MRRETISRWSILSIVATLLVVTVPAAPAFGQAIEGTTTLVAIDAPSEGQAFNVGDEMDFGGWAADPAGPGTGVDAVEIVMDGLRGSGGTSLGMATYGSARSDVATAYGNMDFTNTGYNLIWRVSGTSGRHTAYVYAHSIANGWRYRTVNINISGAAAAPARPTQPYGQGMYGGQMGYGQQYGQGYGQYGQGGIPYDPYNPTGTGYGAYGNRGYGGIPPYGIPPYGGIPPFGGLGYPGAGGVGYTTTVTVVGPASGTVTLTWIAVPAAQSYRIYQANASTPSSFTVVQTITQTTGILTTNAALSGLAAGQLYYVQVRAVDAAGLETVVPASALGGGYPYGYPGYPYGYTVLAAPTGVQVTARAGSSITLGWTAVPGAVGYRVLQSSTLGGPFNAISLVPFGGVSVTTTGTTFTAVTALPISTPVFFQIVAVDPIGAVSSPSATVTTSTCPTAAAC